MAVNADKALPGSPAVTSCCAGGWFLTGDRPVPVHGPGIGDLRFIVVPELESSSSTFQLYDFGGVS